MSYVENIIEKSVTIDDFDFKETANDTTVTPRFKVTLGIMPDYLYDGKGLRIDGVTKNKTADNSGILKGDIIIQLGAIEVTDIYKYMEGLSKYNPGDSTTVKVKRQDEVLEFSIIF
jgi:S1-C subfamily serine protease